MGMMIKQTNLLIFAFILPISFGIYSNETRTQSKLHTDLILNEEYKTSIRPDFETHVQFAFTLVSINDFDEIKGIIHAVGIIYVTWNDSRLSWNRDDYAGIPFFSVHFRDIWRPEISLLNTVSKFEIFDRHQDNFIAWITDIGQVHYSLGGVYSASCDPDVTYFPFDIHECFLSFVPFSDVFFIEYFKNESIQLTEPLINSSDIHDEDGEWEYHAMTPCVHSVGKSNLFAAVFPIRLQRRWKFVFFNVIIPVLLLGYLNLFVYSIPVEAGERVSFAITVLLSYTVFMIVTAQSIPETSAPMPLLSYFLVFKLIYSCCIAVSSIAISRIYHREEDRPISKAYIRFSYIVEYMENCLTTCSVKEKAATSNQNDPETVKEKAETSNQNDPEKPKTVKERAVTSNENDPETPESKPFTWVRVSKALDRAFITLFLFVIITETVVFFVFLLHSYTKNVYDNSSSICDDS